MMKSIIRKTIMMALFLVGICCVPQAVQAEDYSYLVSTAPSVYDVSGLGNGKTTITWSSLHIDDPTVSISYDIELSSNKKFSNAKQYSTNANSLTLNKSTFGKNGGKFYVRTRLVVKILEESSTMVSDWSEAREMTFVKINKTNFPGMYQILKNGSKQSTFSGLKKVVYDRNKDGWLDPEEIDKIWIISTADEYKKKNGVYKVVKASNISSFKGIEYLTQVSSVSIDRFSGTKVDLSKSNVFSVDICGVSAKQLTVIAPTAKTVSIQAANTAKITKMDLSKCSNAVDLLAYGNNRTKVLKLPKSKKKLKVLSLSDYGFRSLNLNSYTNLQQLYIYDSNVKSVKVNKCKNLRYIYFYYCGKIKSLNLKSNKKLRGADFYKSPGLTKTTVKRPKNGKYTWNKGKWWYSTSAYKKDMKKLYK